MGLTAEMGVVNKPEAVAMVSSCWGVSEVRVGVVVWEDPDVAF